MSKITKKQLQESHNKLLNQFASLVRELKVNNVIDDSVCPTFTKKTEPQLKQLDQSVFNGLDEKWQFAAVDKCGEVWYSTHKTQPSVSGTHLSPEPNADSMQAKGYYDASNWQNSLIERDVAKELLEVDLSSELTGSELCKAMLARGDKYVMCRVSDMGDSEVGADITHAIRGFSQSGFKTKGNTWRYAVPINNQGEPLTASEVGL